MAHTQNMETAFDIHSDSAAMPPDKPPDMALDMTPNELVLDVFVLAQRA